MQFQESGLEKKAIDSGFSFSFSFFFSSASKIMFVVFLNKYSTGLNLPNHIKSVLYSINSIFYAALNRFLCLPH